MTKIQKKYLKASEMILEALDEAEGLPQRYLECLHFNISQLTSRMVFDAQKRESADSYKMRRHDWGKGEFPLVNAECRDAVNENQ